MVLSVWGCNPNLRWNGQAGGPVMYPEQVGSRQMPPCKAPQGRCQPPNGLLGGQGCCTAQIGAVLPGMGAWMWPNSCVPASLHSTPQAGMPPDLDPEMPSLAPPEPLLHWCSSCAVPASAGSLGPKLLPVSALWMQNWVVLDSTLTPALHAQGRHKWLVLAIGHSLDCILNLVYLTHHQNIGQDWRRDCSD